MNYFYTRVSPKIPFSIARHTWLTKLYLRLSGGDNAGVLSNIFNVFYTLLFFVWQKFIFISSVGEMNYQSKTGQKVISFNAKNTQFEAVYNPVFKNGYEPEVSVLMQLFLRQGGAFYDIGSNWGYFALFAATLPKYSGQIYAFEPFPSTFSDLVSTVKQADLDRKITCFQQALGNKKASAKMRYKGLLQSGLAALDDKGTSNPTSYLYANTNVNVTTLDDALQAPPALLKIDVEGQELQVLQGGKNLIKKFHPMIIIENCTWNKKVSQTLDPLQLLIDMDYKLFFPCWQIQSGSNSHLSPEFPTVANAQNQILILYPISVQERFLFGRQINIFACHASKLDLIKREFSTLKR